MNYWILFHFIVIGLIPFWNAWNYASLITEDNQRKRRRKYTLMAMWALVAVFGGGYFIYYREAYLNLAGTIAVAAAYAATIWVVAQVILWIPLIVLRLLTLWGGKRYGNMAATFCLVLAFAVSAYGAVDGHLHWERERLEVTSVKLPPSFEGLKIALLADTHIGPYYRLDDLREQLADARRERADYVIIAGDLIDETNPGVLAELQEIINTEATHFTYGIDFVWGNHEYYYDRPRVAEALGASRLRILENTHYELRRGDAGIIVAGVDYPFGKGEMREKEIATFTDAALAGAPASQFRLLIAHHPDFLQAGFERGADLILAGHTHGMQINIAGRPLIPLYTYNRGEFHYGTSVGYVTRGTGHWFPFRIGCPRELTYITLHAGK